MMKEQRQEMKLREQFGQLELCVGCQVEQHYKNCHQYAPVTDNVCAWYECIVNDINKRITNTGELTYNPKTIDKIMDKLGYCPIR